MAIHLGQKIALIIGSYKAKCMTKLYAGQKNYTNKIIIYSKCLIQTQFFYNQRSNQRRQIFDVVFIIAYKPLFISH